MSHTPGPWQITLDRDTKGCGGWRIDSASRSLLAWLPWPMAMHSEEAKANARLIAAAPDLLEALQKMVELTPIARDGSNLMAITGAKEAIRKAIGD